MKRTVLARSYPGVIQRSDSRGGITRVTSDTTAEGALSVKERSSMSAWGMTWMLCGTRVIGAEKRVPAVEDGSW